VSAAQPRPAVRRARRGQVVAGWVVGAVGVVLTLVSIGPQVVTAALAQGASSGGGAGLLVVVGLLTVLELAVPVLVGLAVAGARGRRLLWLGLALVPVAVVWCVAPAFGSLGVFWGPR